jgi:hypothetical protein
MFIQIAKCSYSKRIGVEENCISVWEGGIKGCQPPSFDKLRRLAREMKSFGKMLSSK